MSRVLGVGLLWTCRTLRLKPSCFNVYKVFRFSIGLTFSYITEGSCLRTCLLCNVIDRGWNILLDIRLGFREFKLLKLPFWINMILFYLDIQSFSEGFIWDTWWTRWIIQLIRCYTLLKRWILLILLLSNQEHLGPCNLI